MRKSPHTLLNVAVALAFAIAMIVSASARITQARTVHRAPAALPTLRLNDLVAETHWTHTLDPVFVTDATSYSILSKTQANLVTLLPNGKVGPGLATWTVSPNHKVYTFHLNPKARFSNGDPVTAQDAAFSLTRALAKDTGSPIALTYDGHIVGAADLNNGKTTKLSGVKVLDSHTLRINVDAPIAFFLASLTYPSADVLDPRIVRGQKPNTYITTSCKATVGAGPFRFVCRNNHSNNLDSFFPSGSTPTMTLEPNPYFYGRKPHVKIVIRSIPSTEVNYKQYKAGSIDITGIPTADIAKEKHTPGYLSYSTSQVEYISLDMTSSPFDNVHCRLAVAYAIDRNTLDKKVLHGAQIPIYDVVPKGFLGYYSGKDNPHYNPAKARTELSSCPGGIHNIGAVYAAGSADIANEYAAMGAMFAAVGIDIKPQEVPLNDWYNDVGQPLSKSNIKMVDNGWIEDYQDPQDYCENLLASYAPYDISGYNSKTYDNLMKKANVEQDPKKRAALYIKAQHIALSDGAWISIGNSLAFNLINPHVHGLVGSAAYGFPTAKNEDWSNVTIK